MVFDGDDDPDVCYGTGRAADPAPLRNPDTLTCDSFGSYCDPSCGPCPAIAELAPIPSWPTCFGPCDGKAQAVCETDPQCRVVNDANCEIGRDCLTNFIGCFPIDTVPNTSIDCFTADAWDCSRSNECTALHSYDVCGTDAECSRPFELCVPEGTSPGLCYEAVTCRAVAPSCPSGTTPGVSAGCYTGACIPHDLCEPT